MQGLDWLVSACASSALRQEAAGNLLTMGQPHASVVTEALLSLQKKAAWMTGCECTRSEANGVAAPDTGASYSSIEQMLAASGESMHCTLALWLCSCLMPSRTLSRTSRLLMTAVSPCV